ncbi:MAG: hypothetical protein AAF205_00215 [Pseudomonadota bacterium]
MVRRSTPQKKIDDGAFPIRVCLFVPEKGFGRDGDRAHAWLRDNLGWMEFAWHAAGGFPQDSVGLYFRRLADAQAFLDAFPHFELADTTRSSSYTSPYTRYL